MRHPVLKLSGQAGHLGAVTTRYCMHWHPLPPGEGFTTKGGCLSCVLGSGWSQSPPRELPNSAPLWAREELCVPAGGPHSWGEHLRTCWSKPAHFHPSSPYFFSTDQSPSTFPPTIYRVYESKSASPPLWTHTHTHTHTHTPQHLSKVGLRACSSTQLFALPVLLCLCSHPSFSLTPPTPHRCPFFLYAPLS